MKKFEQGKSANPGGRPKKSNMLAGMAREHTEAALKVIVECLADEKAETRLKAAEILHNRGWGKAQEFVEVSGDGENPLLTKIEVVLKRADNSTGSV